MFLSKRLIAKSVIAGALLIAALGTGTAFAQSYPNKTITLVAPYAAVSYTHLTLPTSDLV